MASKRAIISVHDKTGVVEFAKELCKLGFEIISTGGTAKVLGEAGIKVIEVSEITGFPEILDGRVKTLHPLVHAGILARNTKEHLAQLEQIHGLFIDIVAINLYPFQQTVDAGCDHEMVIENIDIGGPSMIRAACKNYERVAVVTDPAQFERVIADLKAGGCVSEETRFELAREAFHVTAAYDAAIVNYFDDRSKGKKRVEEFNFGAKLVQSVRYGENPHQNAAFFRTTGRSKEGLGSFRQLSGKELSFNNLLDVNAALNIVCEFDDTKCAVAIIKHNNPCGVGLADTALESYEKALKCDLASAFGGIVSCNRNVDKDMAEAMSKLFLEVIAAPKFDDDAKEILCAKSNLRLIEIDLDSFRNGVDYDIKSVSGGYLVQDADKSLYDEKEFKIVTKKVPTEQEMKELMAVWKVTKYVKSNAIVLWKDGATVGVGAGQMNRVGSCKIAVEQAGELAKGSVMGSDAYFPFADTVELAHSAGVTAIIQPGGSIRDKDSIEACDRLGIAMVFTGMRHFRH